MSAPTNIQGQSLIGRTRYTPQGAPADPKLWQAAQDFEEIFMSQFVRTMRESQIKGELTEEGPGRSMFDSMLSDAIGRQMAQSGASGLTPHIYRTLGGTFATPATKETPVTAEVIQQKSGDQE